MEEWKEYRYTDLATIIGGGTPKTSVPEYWSGEIPWLSVKDFVSVTKYVYDTEKHISELGLLNSSTKLLEKNDIVISARGTVGAMAMIPDPMCFNQSCFGLRGNNIVDKNFLYYLTRTKVDELRKTAHGSVFDTITRETFDNLRCLVPPLQTQQKIGNILSSLDSKIELNKRINDNTYFCTTRLRYTPVHIIQILEYLHKSLFVINTRTVTYLPNDTFQIRTVAIGKAKVVTHQIISIGGARACHEQRANILCNR